MITTENKFKILIVDDEQMIRDEFRKVLSPSDSLAPVGMGELEEKLFGDTNFSSCECEPYYDLTVCSQAEEAIEVVNKAIKSNAPFAVAFLDVRMPPGQDGVWTAEHIRESDPYMHIVMVTAYSDMDPSVIAKRVKPPEQLLYVQKPFYPQEIRQFALTLSAKWFAEKELRARNLELTELNKQLNVANKILQKTDRLKTDFVVTISHELRTPMTIFKNVISNAVEGVFGKISESLKQNLKVADKAINRLARSIGDFITLEDMESGSLELNCSPVKVQTSIADVVNKFDDAAAAKQITLQTNLADMDLSVFADQELLNRALSAVIENAIKFGYEKTSVIISASKVKDAVEFIVEDTGIGIEQGDIERVFDKFTQINKQAGSGQHGTGLGLAIAKAIVKLHSGQIWLESIPEKGTKCHFTIPIPKEY
jgi:signal transduction histidine kinase